MFKRGVIIAAGLIALGILIIFGGILERFGGDKNLNVYTADILKRCAEEEFKPDCYDREVPKLMEDLSLEEAFDVLRLIQAEDRQYLFCHVAAHEIADIETKKDPSRWMDVVARCPVTMCNNGCPHGAIMQRFQTEVLSAEQIALALPDLKDVCEPREGWSPTEVERSMCYHSIGHVAMYITGADVPKSLELCQEIGTKDDGRNYYQTCIQGVFMIIFQGIEPEDFALVAKIKPEKEEVNEFCGQFSGDELFACRLETWPLFIDEIRKPEGLVRFCSFTDDPWGKTWCFGVGLTVLTPQFIGSGGDAGVEKISDYCLDLPEARQKQCYGDASSRLVQIDPQYTDEAFALCRLAETYGRAEACYHNLLFYSRYSFHPDSEAFRNYCSYFDEERKNKCLSGDVPTDFYFDF